MIVIGASLSEPHTDQVNEDRVYIYIYIYGNTTHHSVNSAYNSYYTKRNFSYHSFETWPTHVLTKNVYETPEKQIDGKEKLQSNVTSV